MIIHVRIGLFRVNNFTQGKALINCADNLTTKYHKNNVLISLFISFNKLKLAVR